MEIVKTLDGTTLKVAVSGRLGVNTVGELEEVLNSSLDGITELDLDLAGLEFLSSAGLRLILSTQKRMNKQGCMKVFNVNDTVMEILTMTGFTDILTIK